MTQLDYEALTPAQLDQVSFCDLADRALTRPHECRWVLDDDNELIGYRRPLMFNHGNAVKWEAQVISLETGNPIPLLDEHELGAEPRKKFVDVIAEQRAAANVADGDGAARGLAAATVVDTQWIDIHDIEVTSNVRTNWPESELTEMRENFKRRGFLPEVSRLLLRPNPHAGEPGRKALELVLGGRRFQAACDCAISPVPCVVRAMSDAEMIELQLVENIKRKSLTPLDEAEGVCRLLDLRDPDGKPLHSVISLAERLDYAPTQISEARVLRVLRGTPAGDAIDADILSKKHGVLLARVLDPAKRDELTSRIMHTSDGRGVLPREVLAKWIRDEVMVQLRGLEFDPEDETLVPAHLDEAGERMWGGECDGCPQNSKNSDDNRDPHAVPMCMHPGCFKQKVAAAQARWKAEMEGKGYKVLIGDEAKRLIDPATGTRLAATSGYVELADTPQPWEVRDEITSPAPWKKLTKGKIVQTTVLKDAKGVMHEIVEREMAIRAAVENKHDIFRPSVKESKVEETTAPVDTAAIPAVERAADQQQREEAAAQQKQEQERAEHRAARIAQAQFDAVVAASQGTKIPDAFWPLAFHSILRVLDEAGELHLLAGRHGFEGDYGQAMDFMMKKVAKLEAPFRLPLFVESMFALITEEEAEQELPAWAKAFGVDLKRIAKETGKLLDAEEAAAAEADEIASGISWRLKPAAEEFQFDNSLATNPDVALIAIPSGKFNALVGVAQVKGVWVVGYEVMETKKKPRVFQEQCMSGGVHYKQRTLAVHTGLLGVRRALGELGAPPQDCLRVEAYLALLEAKPEKKAGKGKGAK